MNRKVIKPIELTTRQMAASINHMNNAFEQSEIAERPSREESSQSHRNIERSAARTAQNLRKAER
jgi:hypothetical protein